MAAIDESVYIADGAHVSGDVTIGRDSSVWHGAVVRADIAQVTIGERTNVQDNAVIHVAHAHPVTIGDDVTIGHGAIVHGCTIEDGALIGMGAIVLNGAVIGEGALVGAGSLVTEGHRVTPHTVAFGSPAREVRRMSDEEMRSQLESARLYVELARAARIGA